MIKNIKLKRQIIILSIISLACKIIGQFMMSLQAEYWNSGIYFVGYGHGGFQILINIIVLSPYILFLIYIIKLHNHPQIALIFASVLIFSKAFTLIINFADTPSEFIFLELIRYFILNIPGVVASCLIVISAINGFDKKWYIVTAVIIRFVLSGISLLSLSFNLAVFYEDLPLYIVPQLMFLSGAVTFNAALLLFGLNNRIIPMVSRSPAKERARIAKMPPEQALVYLNEKLDLGLVTEEEYQAQRAEAISRL